MRYLFKSFLLVFALYFLSILPAQADVFHWQDPVSKASMTVPDTWRQIHRQKPDDVVTFIAPGPSDYASCRLRVRQDRRFVIYPARFSDEVQRLHYAQEFWTDYLAMYEHVNVHKFHNDSGLGRGFASYVEASYVTTAGPKMQKRAIIFAALYRDKAYIAECSAEAHAYHKWHYPFYSVVKSVDFRKSVHEFPSGHYRNFSNDDALEVYGPGGEDVRHYW